MKERKLKVVKHWSYSAYSLWKSCAFKFYCEKRLGLKGPPIPAMQRGTAIHALQENLLKGKIYGIPHQLKAFGKELSLLKRQKPIVEEFWGVDQEWSFQEKKSWCVMKMDAALPPTKKNDYELYVQDLKTGKAYGSHESQGNLYACIGLAKYPEAKKARVEFWYVDQGYVQTFDYTAKQLKRHIPKWQERGHEMLDPKQKYLPSPSDDACKWCHLRSNRGGPCQEWKKSPNAASFPK